jgi:hypothetical protein
LFPETSLVKVDEDDFKESSSASSINPPSSVDPAVVVPLVIPPETAIRKRDEEEFKESSSALSRDFRSETSVAFELEEKESLPLFAPSPYSAGAFIFGQL